MCALPDEIVQQVNAAIWNSDRLRKPAYRANACRVLELHDAKGRKGDNEIDPKVITRHAEHIERSWRFADVGNPPSGTEKPVMPPTFDQYVDKAMSVGDLALEALKTRIETGDVEDKDLIGAAKLGAGTAVARQRASEKPQDGLNAGVMVNVLFGVASGHLAAPEGEMKVVAPVSELRNEFEEERRALVAHARGEAESAEPD